MIRCVPPAYLLGTKLEAFAGRGRGDYFGSPDFEDIVALVDGRVELVDEVKASDSSLRVYLATEIGEHLASERGRSERRPSSSSARWTTYATGARRPVAFTWRLKSPMPEELFEIARSVAAA